MTTRKNRLLPVLLTILLSSHGSNAQTIPFKKYSNADHRFSLDIPSHWKIINSKEEGGIICVPLTASEKEEYKDCFEGIVFRMEFFKSGLDSALAEAGMYTKKGNTYSTRDRTGDSVQAKNITGTNWRGIYHNNVCEINCQSTGIHAIAGQCEFLYFSNDQMTVCIETNGRAFDPPVLKRLLASFRFHK
jgi:hypothetical protein